VPRCGSNRAPIRFTPSARTWPISACATDDLTGLRIVEVGAEPTVVLVPRGHPLCRVRRVTVARVAATEGFQARCPLIPLAEIVDRVAFTGLVVLAAADTAPRLGPDVRAVPVVDAPATVLCAVRHPRRTHPSVTGFVRHLREAGAHRASA
jgi:hypothetical protein